MNLILASSSPYRCALLARLCVPFTAVRPGVDESPRDGEAPETTVRRLSVAKAQAAAAGQAAGLVIGSDQLAVVEGQVLGKPGDHATARRQLCRARGRQADFLTGLCVLDAGSGRVIEDCVRYAVRFRPLTDAQIEHYLRVEQPYDCAGSFKCEGLGIALFESMAGSDPTALSGLPLIRLTGMLADFGFDVLAHARA